MKKLITLLLIAVLFLPCTSFAKTRLLSPASDYKGTITGLRVSAVDGTAFIDNLPYVYSSDFSVGVDGWTTARGTVAGNIDDIPATDDNWLRFTVNTDLGAHYVIKSISFVAGRTYTISFNYYIPSGQTVVAGIGLTNNSGVPIGARGLTLDAITTYTILYTPQTTNTELRIYATNAAGSSAIQDAGGDDVFYIKDVTISEITPYMDGNHSIEIYDSSNRMLKGVLKAAGTSEGLGSDTARTFVAETGTPTIAGDQITFSNAIEGVIENDYWVSGKLYLADWSISSYAGSGSFYLYGGGLPTSGIAKAADGSYLSYITSNSVNLRIGKNLGCSGIATVNSIKQVLTPSALGATIVSAKAGETYNWSYKNSSFAYNQSSYFCIIKAIR